MAPVTADAVDTPMMGAIPSFLPPGPDMVARALLARSELRGLSAAQLARALHASVTDARTAIASIASMVNATARGRADAALTVDSSLMGAIGPFLSLDQAMSRFGSHMGPIVTGPTPSLLHAPDAGPDRAFGAGYVATEAGDVPGADLVAAAHQLQDFLTQNGCGVAFAGICENFQNLFNQSYSPAIGLDDEYGQQTQGALDQVIADADAAQPGTFAQTAPPFCTYAKPAAPSAPTAPAAPSSPASPTAPVRPVQASMLGTGNVVLLLLVAGAAIIATSKHPPKWARKVGLAHGAARR